MPSFTGIATISAACIVVFAVALKVVLFPALLEMLHAPLDPSIGKIEFEDTETLKTTYNNKRALLIGGTRGIGYGTALAMAKAGAHVTIVGRSEKSGTAAVDKIRSQLDDGTSSSKDQVEFIQGDIGTICSATSLINKLASIADTKDELRYDYLVVTAAVFPDWDAPSLLNEDGIEKSFAIAVVGRYLIYRNVNKFLRNDENDSKIPRVLNVLASGMDPPGNNLIDRDLITGKRNVNNLLEALLTMGVGNELMLDRLNKDNPYTMVSTHPGFLKTDLHRGQGLAFDVLEWILIALAGVSEEECGQRQASILASDKLHVGGISLVDNAGTGRLKSSSLNMLIDEHGDWLWTFLNELEERGASCAQ